MLWGGFEGKHIFITSKIAYWELLFNLLFMKQISGETASSTVNTGSLSDLANLANASLYGFEDYHGVDIGVVRAVRLWYSPLEGEVPIEIKIKESDTKLGFAISRTEEVGNHFSISLYELVLILKTIDTVGSNLTIWSEISNDENQHHRITYHHTLPDEFIFFIILIPLLPIKLNILLQNFILFLCFLSQGFIYISSVAEGDDNAPSTRSGLCSLYKEANRSGKLLVVSRVSNQKVLPWIVSQTGAIRCYDTVSLSQKLSLHRHARVSIHIHIFSWDRGVTTLIKGISITSPTASSLPPETLVAHDADDNQVFPFRYDESNESSQSSIRSKDGPELRP